MRFRLIDAITELTRGERIVAVKAVSLAEEYLADHFPTFPVLPGVLMLETLTEAAAWLVRDALDFAPGLILLREAKNVTYKSFVRPGQLLRVEVRCRRMAPGDSDFEGTGYCGEVEAVRGRFGLVHRDLTDQDPAMQTVQRRIADDARRHLQQLRCAPAGR